MNNVKRNRILLVEDDPDTLMGLRHVLINKGFDVLIAKNGGEAKLLLAGADQVDLVLLDLGLPVADGHSVLDWKRGIESLEDVPVIVLSAWSKSHHGEAAREAGAIGYVEKPAKVDSLLGEIESVLGPKLGIPDVIG